MKLSLKVGLYILALSVFISACNSQKKVVRKHPVVFEKHTILSEFISEGSTVADINNDGKMDIIAGAFWFEAPSWKEHELAKPQVFEFDKGYSNSFLNFSMDVNEDGWMDIIWVDFPGNAVVWHENPQNEAGHWKEHVIYQALGNENPLFVDMDGDGREDLIGNDPKTQEVIWLKAPGKGEADWKKIVVSAQKELATHQFTHGLGADDLNGDGNNDILINRGWWEAPADIQNDHWQFHPENFGDDCAQMYVLDVNGDDLPDIISSSAHNYGIWWYQQQHDGSGKSIWTKHVIDSTFSQSHGLVLKDMNGDGNPDLITGKRFFAHNGHDPGAHEPAVLYWYEFLPGEQPSWMPHEIDSNSGIGLNFAVDDMNGDSLPDIVVSNKKGVHYFEQK